MLVPTTSPDVPVTVIL